jgi:osmotically-inducible protein OsmY
MAESHRARRIANETAGVGGVVNALYIDPALAPFDEGHAPAPPDDQTLEERLQVALAHDADLADETIQVEVDDGIVRLDGTISDAAFEMRAKRVAKSLYGVERVKSNLEVSAP